MKKKRKKRKKKHDPVRARALKLKHRYKLTPLQFDRLWLKQGEVCAICRTKPHRRPNVDHDHSTGKVRGLLCHRCNLGLGQFQDSHERLQRAAAYLRGKR